MPVSEARFVVFDTETTGLDLSTNRLLSIAAVAVKGLEVRLDDAFEALISQTDVGGAEAAVIHGLVSSDLGEGLAEYEAAARFLAFAGDSILVAHHVAFDIRMLRKAIAAYRGVRVWNPVVDTARLARRVEEGAMSSGQAQGVDSRGAYQLDRLVERYAIDAPERHTAAGDALATALLFLRLLSKAGRRGIRTIGDLVVR
jgi:DNA polymerase-3 subunit epsilon